MSSNKTTFSINTIEQSEKGKKLKVQIKFPLNTGWIDDVSINIEKGNEYYPVKLKYKKIENEEVYFEEEIFLETRALYKYYFSCFVHGQKKYIDKNNNIKDYINNDEKNKISINFKTPDWAKGKIMYHIFVDRFNRGSNKEMQQMPRRTIHKNWNEELVIGPDKDGIWNNDFFGGDLKGIQDKLDYIESLGVLILYLSPIVYSQSNHRYDTSDYENVDPYAGSNENLKSLCEEAHKRGMKVVLDAVFNHTGNDSIYFNEYNQFNKIGAYQNPNSPYYDFYKKTYHEGKTYFDYWWGMTNLPVCDGYSKQWKNYILGEGGVIDKWYNLGIDGLRLDVADDLTDEFIEGIRIASKRNKEDSFILGEVWKNPMRMNRGYIESGKGMDSVMNYTLVDALIRYIKYGDIDKIAAIIKDIKNEYPDETIHTLMNFTSTHDITRAINIFGTDEFQKNGEWAWDPNINDIDYCKNKKLTPNEYQTGKEKFMAYSFALAFLPGILSIFYGDEVGIQGHGNLQNRKTFPWDNIDKELKEFFTYIGSIKKEEKFLEKADLEILKITKEKIVFERKSKKEKLLTIINRTNKEINNEIPKEYEDSKKCYSLKKSDSNKIAPYGGFIIKI